MNIDSIKKNIIFTAIAGSRSYGIHVDSSDYDIRSIFVIPLGRRVSLEYYPGEFNVKEGNKDYKYYEIQKFLHLGIKGNPNVIELIFSPDSCIEYCQGDIFKNNIFANRFDFISANTYYAYRGYAYSYVKKLNNYSKMQNRWQNIENVNIDLSPINLKFMTHVIRLLLSLSNILENGEPIVEFSGENLNYLRKIRSGQCNISEVRQHADELFKELDSRFESSELSSKKVNIAKIDDIYRAIAFAF